MLLWSLLCVCLCFVACCLWLSYVLTSPPSLRRAGWPLLMSCFAQPKTAMQFLLEWGSSVKARSKASCGSTQEPRWAWRKGRLLKSNDQQEVVSKRLAPKRATTRHHHTRTHKPGITHHGVPTHAPRQLISLTCLSSSPSPTPLHAHTGFSLLPSSTSPSNHEQDHPRVFQGL